MDEADLRRILESSAAETRAHFDVISEGLRAEVRLVAEGVTSVGERVDRLSADIKEEFTEVRSMIRFSHAELDRRLNSLETSVSDLQARVERLESRPTQ